MLLAQSLVTVLLPLPLKFLTDEIFVDAQKTSYSLHFWAGAKYEFSIGFLIFHSLLVLFLLGAASAILEYLEESYTVRLSTRVVDRLRLKLIDALFSRSMDFLDSRRKVDLLGRISSDTANVSFLVSSVMPTALRSVPTLIFIVVSMLLVDWRLALVVGFLLPGMLFLCQKFSLKSRGAVKSYSLELARFEADTVDTLSAMPLVKSLGVERKTQNALFRRVRATTERLIEAQRLQGKLVASLSGSKYLARFLIVLIGSFGVLKQSMTIGELVLFVSYIELLSKPVSELAKLSSKVSRAVVSIDRIEALFQDMRGLSERGGQIDLVRNVGAGSFALQLDGVTLAFPDSRALVTNFSARFMSGEFVVIRGDSGAGKTSFGKLMNRLHDPVAGSIRIGGIDLRSATLPSVRDFVCFLAQETYFMHGTLRENLALAEPGVEEAELMSALQKVNAFAFVDALPDGIDTRIGEGGRMLSGGQERRLSLARAFLRPRARVFVFDEPTSGLDGHSSRIVLASAKELAARGALVFWITHNPNEAADETVLEFVMGENPRLRRKGEAPPGPEIGLGNLESEIGSLAEMRRQQGEGIWVV